MNELRPVEGFYRLNNAVLKFDPIKDVDKIIFNHYLMRRENMQRLKHELPEGQFYLSENIASKDLNMSRSKITRLIELFKQLGIIEVITIFPKHLKKASIYQYLIAITTYKELQKSEHQNEHQNEHQSEQSKKELIKKNTKKDNKYIVEILDYMNTMLGTNYRATTQKTRTLINSRMKEGFTVDDFKTVIATKYMEWGKDEKMKKYLRPETLFGTKFEGYLNQVPKHITGNDNEEEPDPF